MSDAVFQELKDPRFQTGFRLGLQRSKLAAPPSLVAAAPNAGERWPLIAAALLAQQTRYAWPAPPALVDVSPLPRPEGRLPDENLRARLRALVPMGADITDWHEAIWSFLAPSGLALHPFDLAELKPLLQATGARLGPTERAWLRGPGESVGAEVEASGSGSWLELMPAAQSAFMRARREEDAAEGRNLIQSGLQGQAAAVRCRLVEALEVALSSDDQEVLESLKADRAKSVKEAAANLLSRIPGTAEYEERLDEAEGMLETVKKGIVGKKKSLRLRKHSRRDRAAEASARSCLRHTRTEDLAARFDLTVEGLYAATAKDARLQSALLMRALLEGPQRLSVAAKHLQDTDIWDIVYDFDDEHGGGLGADAISLLLRPKEWARWPDVFGLRRLARMSRGPLPADLARQVIDCKALKSAIKLTRSDAAQPESLEPSALVSLVRLVPIELHPALEERLSSLPPHLTTSAMELIRFAAALPEPGS